MEEIVYSLNLDLRKNTHQVLVMKEDDVNSRVIKAVITDNGKPYDLTNCAVNLKWKKPDGHIVYADTERVDDSTVKVICTDQMLAVAGTAEAEFDITSTTAVASTLKFMVSINETVIANSDIESSDEFGALQDAMAQYGLMEYGEYLEKENPVGTGSFSMNRKANTTVGNYSHAEGYDTTASGDCSHAEGYGTTASDNYSHAEGQETIVKGQAGHAEGYRTKVTFKSMPCVGAHAEGIDTEASGFGCHAEGNNTLALKEGSHAEGELTIANGNYCHAEGAGTEATGDGAHAEGIGYRWLEEGEENYPGWTFYRNKATGIASHVEGYWTMGEGDYSHAEGNSSNALGGSSHAEGHSTTAGGKISHAEGEATVASGTCQHVQGKYNEEDTENKYAHIVGGGTSDTDRKNIHTLDWQGNAVFAGDVTYNGSQSLAEMIQNLCYCIGTFKDAKIVSRSYDELGEVKIACIPYSECKDLTTDNKIAIKFTDGSVGIATVYNTKRIGEISTWLTGSLSYVNKDTIQGGTNTLAIASSGAYSTWDDTLYNADGTIVQRIILEISSASGALATSYRII